MYKYVLFDLDGTLTDPKEGITACIRYALPFLGITPPPADQLLDLIGPPLFDSFSGRFGLCKSDAEFAVEKYRERFSTIGLYENRVYDGIPEMLESLKNAGCILAVASLKPTVFVERILEKFQLKKYFSAICGSDLEGTKHTKKQIIEDALAILSPSNLSEVIMVGDRWQDVEGAKEVGISSLGVSYGYSVDGEFESAGADFVADTPEEITEIILKQRD